MSRRSQGEVRSLKTPAIASSNASALPAFASTGDRADGQRNFADICGRGIDHKKGRGHQSRSAFEPTAVPWFQASSYRESDNRAHRFVQNPKTHRPTRSEGFDTPPTGGGDPGEAGYSSLSSTRPISGASCVIPNRNWQRPRRLSRLTHRRAKVSSGFRRGRRTREALFPSVAAVARHGNLPWGLAG